MHFLHPALYIDTVPNPNKTYWIYSLWMGNETVQHNKSSLSLTPLVSLHHQPSHCHENRMIEEVLNDQERVMSWEKQMTRQKILYIMQSILP